jgi:hypothetical protein
MSFSIQLYTEAGLSENNTFNFNIAQYSTGIIGMVPMASTHAFVILLMPFLGSIGSWLLMNYVGRRTIYLYGFFVMFLVLLGVGSCGVAPRSSASAYGAGSLLLVYTFFYNLTIGSIGYTLVTEIPSQRLKNNTVALARCAYNVVRTRLRYHRLLGRHADLIDLVQYHRQRADASHAEPQGMELGRQDWLFLGWRLCPPLRLVVLPPPRTQGPHQLGA